MWMSFSLPARYANGYRTKIAPKLSSSSENKETAWPGAAGLKGRETSWLPTRQIRIIRFAFLSFMVTFRTQSNQSEILSRCTINALSILYGVLPRYFDDMSARRICRKLYQCKVAFTRIKVGTKLELYPASDWTLIPKVGARNLSHNDCGRNTRIRTHQPSVCLLNILGHFSKSPKWEFQSNGPQSMKSGCCLVSILPYSPFHWNITQLLCTESYCREMNICYNDSSRMSDNKVLGKATAEEETAKQLVELLLQIKERLPASSSKDKIDFSKPHQKDENYIHWRDIVKHKLSDVMLFIKILLWR